MIDPLDRDAAEARRREERRLAEREERQQREDLKEVMALPAMRRLLARFIDDAGLDRSAFRPDPNVMSFAAGWQDAARWWIEPIRAHCPEREVQLRAEARKARKGATDEAEDEPE